MRSKKNVEALPGCQENRGDSFKKISTSFQWIITP